MLHWHFLVLLRDFAEGLAARELWVRLFTFELDLAVHHHQLARTLSVELSLGLHECGAQLFDGHDGAASSFLVNLKLGFGHYLDLKVINSQSRQS